MGRTSDARERLMDAVAELFWTVSYDRTTIDQICEKAGVKKGSFYYFFDDKAALAEAALEVEWQKYRPRLDTIFSSSLPPLERIRAHCAHIVEEQVELKAKYGHVLGCPLATLGSEICTQDNQLRRKVQEIMEYGHRYLESTLRDALAAGLIRAADAGDLAARLRAYQLGLLMQARIQDDLGVLADLERSTFALIGAPLEEGVPA